MPRPGPRPYECVRRAWHSERHQPMRGSLIQEIFRVVNEIHSSVTKKNKEWQEKLPTVVLKAEEIMYSKANSEAEYTDLITLCDRANDAINTIIRRDESTETGQLLQPCIEAALLLGCTPRRASRSQRNTNPRCYLSASSPEQTRAPPNNLENILQGNQIPNTPFMSQNPNFTKSMNLTLLGPNSQNPIPQNHNHTVRKFPFSSGCFPPCLPRETYASSNPCSVYPLYHGSELQYQESQFSVPIPSNLNSSNPKPAKTGLNHNLSRCDLNASNKKSQAGLSIGVECDLSLRLGPLSVPCISIENSWPQDVEDIDSRSSRECKKSSDLAPRMDKEFSFFPKTNADNSLDSCSSERISEVENKNLEIALRKRKAVFAYLSEDGQFNLQPKLQKNEQYRFAN